MATEYYIVKPKTKQVFYLGKRISYLDGLKDWRYSKKATFPTWECYEDLVFDIYENAKYFLEGHSDATVGQIWDFCSAIWDFCDNEVYFDNDCNDDNLEWRDWQVIDVFEKIFELPELEKWAELYQLVPPEEWVTKDHVLYEYETVKNWLQKQYNKLKGEK